MARTKYPKLNELVRRGVAAEDLDELHYEEEQPCRSTLIVTKRVTNGMKSDSMRARKRRSLRVQRADKTESKSLHNSQ